MAMRSRGFSVRNAQGGRRRLDAWTVVVPSGEPFQAPSVTPLKSTRSDRPSIIGNDPQLQAVLEAARRVAPTRIPVLITGESGTGKELVAGWVHASSNRAREALVTINCAAFPDNLLEDELFGHRRGSFTGATADRPGLLESADGGTVLLDEVAEMSPACQAKLLRFLEGGTVRPLGSNEEKNLDVRIVAATHRDLLGMVRQGAFREDLYYRLTGDVLRIPPLRERPGDVEALALHFLTDDRRLQDHTGRRLTDEAIRHLAAYPWPGNVRELRNVVQRAAVHAKGEEIGVEVIRALLPVAEVEPRHRTPSEVVAALPAKILRHLQEHGETRAADLRAALEVPRSTLHRQLQPLVESGQVLQSGEGKSTRYRARDLELAPNRNPTPLVGMDADRWAILGPLLAQGTVSKARFMEAAGLADRTACRFLTRMVELGLLREEGKGRARGYKCESPTTSSCRTG